MVQLAQRAARRLNKNDSVKRLSVAAVAGRWNCGVDAAAAAAERRSPARRPTNDVGAGWGGVLRRVNEGRLQRDFMFQPGPRTALSVWVASAEHRI
ncbi:unnamed protein product [Macrosiphum euphorbiae]|uniref:Uncharacterized protein n=1 Tax=Macrosiphum euphorbiae TaxID=13131 RepID=A0AAV0XBH2_9HEMI|nr:unnamed protein product [Macrosiphum euphorbiae]